MRNEEKNKWKQKSSNLPLGIKAKVGLAVKVGAVALGFHVWGIDFIWVVLGFTFCYDILRGIFSCLVTLVALAGFFYFLFAYKQSFIVCKSHGAAAVECEQILPLCRGG